MADLLPERLELLVRRQVRHALRRLHRGVVRPAAPGAEQRGRHRGRAGQHLRVLHSRGAFGDGAGPRLSRAPQFHVRIRGFVGLVGCLPRLLLEGSERGPALERVRHRRAPRRVFGEHFSEKILLWKLTGKVHSLQEHLPQVDQRGSASAVDVLVHLLGVVELEHVPGGSLAREAGVLLRVPRERGGDPRAPQVVPVTAHVAPEHLAAAGLPAETKLALLALRGLAGALKIRGRRPDGLHDELQRGD